MYNVQVKWALGDNAPELLFKTERGAGDHALLLVAHHYKGTLNAGPGTVFNRGAPRQGSSTLSACESLFQTPCVVDVRQYMETKGPGVHICIVQDGPVIVLHISNDMQCTILMRVWKEQHPCYTATQLTAVAIGAPVNAGDTPRNAGELMKSLSTQIVP